MHSLLFGTALLLSLSTVAFCEETTYFSPCEKTYIKPEHVVLEKKAICIETENYTGQTSALYRDNDGLFFVDIQFIPTVEIQPLPIQEVSIENDEPSLLFSDAPVEEKIIASPPIREISPLPPSKSPPPNAKPPKEKKKKPAGWPYSNKQR